MPGKQPKNSAKDTRNTQNSCFSAVWLTVSAVFRLFSRHFTRGPLGTFLFYFPGCFQGLAFGASAAGQGDRKIDQVIVRVLSATLILSKNSRILGAKSRLKSANLS